MSKALAKTRPVTAAPVLKKSPAAISSQTKPSSEAILPQVDRLIHERLRLGIVSALAANTSLTFNDLKRLLETTDGNLSVHARKLEEAGYVACTKTFEGRMPKTEYSLTPTGRKALEKYLNHMEALIEAMRPLKDGAK
jgi:DNA-binding HxlR family transcriptional regulator